MYTMIENYINGNITAARKQAKRFLEIDITLALFTRYGYSRRKATLTAHHMKTGEGWQAACDAE